MTTSVDESHPALPRSQTVDTGVLDQQGIAAGLVGAVVIALWFLVVDALSGRPLYTPSVLGTAVFQGKAALASPDTLPVSVEMALMFTWVHGLVFMILGTAASRLIGLAERNPNLGFGIVLFFVVFEFGFIVGAMAMAEEVLQALAWPAILVGNLLAAAAMAAYFSRRHPHLQIRP